MIPLYWPGHSLLHRTPAAAKLAALLVVGIMVSLLRGEPWVAVGVWGVVLAGYLAAFRPHRGLGHLLRRLWSMKWLVVLIAVPQLLFLPVDEASITTARIIAIILLAGLFTLTTPVSEVMDLVLSVMRPLERIGLGRIGVTADRVALAIALAMRSVPVVFGFYSEIRQARAARGASTGPAAAAGMTAPLLVMTLRHAEQTAEALAARGVR